jgi:hypothetical protein
MSSEVTYVRKLRTLPYFQTSWKSFISLNRTFEIVDLSGWVGLEDMHYKEKA